MKCGIYGVITHVFGGRAGATIGIMYTLGQVIREGEPMREERGWWDHVTENLIIEEELESVPLPKINTLPNFH